MIYQWLKPLHIFLVVSTYALFFLRGIWRFRESPLLQNRWSKTVPHVVDTLLLFSAIALALTIHQYPFIDIWLTAKMLGLMLYIGLGFVALRSSTGKVTRIFTWLAAQVVFLYIVLVAITHNPIP
ncbi:MAG: SirB2 family protein [Burkholderiales bacterium]|nr:SirB2 family protein [Ferrovum sp.]